MDASRARPAHLVVGVVAAGALALQLVLVVQGSAVLVDTDPPSLAARVGRYFCYFTIQSNALVAGTALALVRDSGRDGRTWRGVRLAAVVGITITALVHVVLLRPLLDLDGLDAGADTLLHVVVPVLAVAAWLGFGPRPRVDRRAIGVALLWPVAWLAFALAVWQLTGWVPYPFLDADEKGWTSVGGACLGVTVLFVAACGGAYALDRTLPPAPPT